MGKIRRFGTFYVVSADKAKHLENIRVGRSWKIHVTDDPSWRHWCHANTGWMATTLTSGDDRKHLPRGLVPAKQIVIESASETTAERVASLIRCGSLLGYPDLLRQGEAHGIYPIDEVPAKALRTLSLASRFQEATTGHVGCHAAASAWDVRGDRYALEKYHLSLQLDWFTPHSANPIYGQKFPNSYREFSYHVKATMAIVAAYSVIEELGLEPRSSEKNPRFIRDPKQRWNPSVLDNLNERLSLARIDPKDDFIWVLRGAPTRIETELRPKLGVPSKLYRRHDVRDRQMKMADALHYSSWLRNFVAAHKLKDISSSVSPYDVFNVQGIARRVLLGKLGLWGKFQD